MSKLYVTDGPDKGKSFALCDGITTIGRSPDNGIRISDRRVSRHHAKLVKRDGRICIEDLNSLQGVILDGEKIEPGLEVKLEKDSKVRMGKTVLSFRKKASEETATQPYPSTTYKTRSDTSKSSLAPDSSRNYAQSLELLVKVSSLTARPLSIDRLLGEILDQILSLLKRIDRGAILLVNKETGDLEEAVSKTRMEDKGGLSSEITYSRTIVKRTIEDGQPVMISDTSLVNRADLSDSMERMNVRSVMCVPLTYKGDVRGVIYVDSIGLPEGFRKDDLQVLAGLGNTAAIAIENARLYEEAKRELAERERAEAALQKARGQLEERIKERTAELSKTIELLKQEIANRKRAEEALRESEERYRNLSEQSGDAIYISTREGKLPYINHSFLDLFGYAKEEIGDLKAQEMYADPDDRSRFQQEIEQKGSVRDFDVKLCKKNGTEMDCLITATVRQADEGRILGYQGIIRDITEHKRTDEALRESEEKYRAILEGIEEGYFEVDLAGNLTFFNDSLCRITGYPREELMGMNYREYTAPETAKRMYQVFNKMYRTGKPARVMDHEIIAKDRSTVVLEMSTSLMRGPAGEPIGFRGVVRDVTERKRAEEEKEKLETQLQQAQKMEAIGTLAGGIAHNFNNLLMGILGNTSLMLLETDSHCPNYERLNTIEKLVQSGSKLTSQLLGYAREGKYHIKPISLNEVVKETSNTFGTTRKDIRLHQELAEDVYGIKAEQGQIEQVLWNLYVNAADAMPGGGELFLKTMNVTHKDMKNKSYKAKPGNYVLLTVRDTGMGMGRKTMGRIFDPFFTTKGLANGTGLGLSSVYGMIKAHGGYIDVDSRKGQGTTFSICLPALDKEAPEEKLIHKKIERGHEMLLLVDDEAMILDVGQEMLKELGYSVLIARGGREAIEIYEQNKHTVGLVILDMIMPGMGGGETYDRLKKISPDIKVLLSSGYSIDGQAQEILDRGCDGFIQKPFNIRELSQEVRKILDS